MEQKEKEKMRAPALVGIVAALHVGGLGLLVLMQGCGTTLDRQAKYESLKNVEPPPEPVFPSKRRASTENTVVKTSETHPVEVLPLAKSGTVYTLKKGQTLSHVAKHFGLSARSLAEYNQIRNVDMVNVRATFRRHRILLLRLIPARPLCLLLHWLRGHMAGNM